MGLTASEFGSGSVLILFSVFLTACLWSLIMRILRLKEKDYKRALLVVSAYNAPFVLSLLFSTGFAEAILGGLAGILSLIFLQVSLIALYYSITSVYDWKGKRALGAFLIIFFSSILSYLFIFIIRPFI